MNTRRNGCYLAITAATLLTFAQFGCRAAAPAPSQIELEGVRNLSRAGDIYIAGRPNAAGLAALQERGVAAVIDLRLEEYVSAEEVAAVEEAGLTRIHLPMTSAGVTDEQAEAFLAAMDKHAGKPILIHCGGANRAGAMYGLYLGARGICDVEEAMKRAKAAGMRSSGLDEGVRRYLAEHE